MSDAPQDQARERPQISHADVQRRAEALWREYGCPEGRDEEIWLEAENQLLGPIIRATSDPERGSPASPGSGSSDPVLSSKKRRSRAQASELMENSGSSNSVPRPERRASEP